MFRFSTPILLLLMLIGASVPTHAQTRQVLQGDCERGNNVVVTDNRSSVTKVQRSFPSCTITVYDAGTTDLADIYTNEGGTPKSNPFIADADGHWSFWADPGRFDVRLSGSGIPSPFTRSNLWVASGGGGSGITACGGATTGAITKFTSSSTICNSIITESGTTATVTGQLIVNQQSTSVDGIAVQAAAGASSPSFNVKDSSGSTRFGTRPAGVPYFARFTSAPSVSASDTATLYYDESGGSNNGMLALSRDGGSYQFVISAATDGSNGQCLQTNGSKVFSFGACGSSLTLDNEEVAYGTGSGVTSSDNFKYESAAGAIKLAPFGTSAGNTSVIRHYELAANGTDYFGQKGPDALASSRTLVWPSDNPSASDVLTVTSFTGGVITTEWAPAGGSSSCPPGGSTSKQVLYNLGGACTGAVEFEYQQSASPNVYIRAQDPTYTALQLRYDTGSQSADIFQVVDESATVEFGITASGTPYTPNLNGSQTGMRAGAGAFANLTGAAYGDSSNSTLRSVAVGDSANASSVEAVAIGQSAGANHSQSVCIGYDCSTFSTNQFIVGSRQAQANNVYFGAGGDETVAGTSAVTINGSRPNNNNYPGGDIILAAGLNRGTGVGTSSANSQASVRLQTSTLDGTSGSSQGSLVDRYIANGLKKIITVNNTATSLFEISLPTLRGASGTVILEVHVEDATDVQELYQQVSFAVVNKGGTYTKTVNTEQSRTALSTGTLSATSAFLDGTNKVTFQVTPNSSLTFSTARYWISYTLINNSEQAITQL